MAITRIYTLFSFFCCSFIQFYCFTFSSANCRMPPLRLHIMHINYVKYIFYLYTLSLTHRVYTGMCLKIFYLLRKINFWFLVEKNMLELGICTTIFMYHMYENRRREGFCAIFLYLWRHFCTATIYIYFFHDIFLLLSRASLACKLFIFCKSFFVCRRWKKMISLKELFLLLLFLKLFFFSRQ